MNTNNPKNTNTKKSRGWVLLLGFVLAILVLMYFMPSGNKGQYISIKGEYNEETQPYTSLEELIGDGTKAESKVKYIYCYGTTGYVLLRDSKIQLAQFPANADYYFTFGYTADITTILDMINTYNDAVEKYNNLPENADKAKLGKITYISEPVSESWIESFLPYLSILVALIFGWFLLKSILGANSKSMTFGKTRANMAQNVKTRFTDVAGIDEEKEELEEVVEFLKNPQKFRDLGAKIPKGVLMVGQPGTGKTLLAKAIAGESNVPFFSISGSDFVEMFVGVGASRVRDLFEQAKKHAPCIVFIDEIDAVGRQRGAGLGGGNDEREQTLNQLLVQMDGFEGNEGIIVIAATNRSDVLDPALLRPGRFDRQIVVNPPDVKGREKILEVHARKKPIDESVSFKTIAKLTSGFTGADLENLLNEAAILTARNGRKKITMVDIQEGINKVIMGPQKKSRVITEEDKKITAFHEAGHAIIGRLLEHCDVVQEVSIIPRGMAAGYTISRPEKDENHMSYNKLMDMITMMLGGRVAEECLLKDICTGASNDIERVTKIARKMVTEWGMSEKMGNITYGKSNDHVFMGRDFGHTKDYSEEVAAKVDAEVKNIVDTQYELAKRLLTENKDVMEAIVKVLLEKETLEEAEAQLKELGFSITYEERNSEVIEKGFVISTDPSASAKKGSSIKIIVSKGTSSVVLENYVGKDYYEVEAALTAKGIKSVLYSDSEYPALLRETTNAPFMLFYLGDISVLSGKVINVKEDDSLGKIIEIEHDKDFISIYQSLSEVNVKKDDIINQGQVIGTSGTNELDKELGNHLHFELYYNGKIVNPEEYYNRNIDEL